MKRLITIFVLIFVVGIHAAAPRLAYDASKEAPFTITFDTPQFAACTVYQSLTETIEQEGKVVPYAPRHCGMFSTSRQLMYVDDWAYIIPNGGEWDVWAELYDEQNNQTQTNVVRVKH
jgi:hypothetical protein